MSIEGRVFMHEESKNMDVRTDEQEQNINTISNANSATIGQSGNSDVDVKIDVHVDTTAIGYAILCSLLATKQMDNDEFKMAVRKLEELTRKSFSGRDINDVSTVKLFNQRIM